MQVNISLRRNTSIPKGFGLESPHCIPLLLSSAFSMLPVVTNTLFKFQALCRPRDTKNLIYAVEVIGEF